MKRKNSKRVLVFIILVCLVIIFSYFIEKYTSISNSPFFIPLNLFVYFGILIGFSLTLYTFGLSMIPDIIKKICDMENITDESKKQMRTKLLSGFNEVKEDIWIIFYSLIIVIIINILNYFPNSIECFVNKFKIPNITNISLFIISTFAMWDIMKTFFNISEINLELNKSTNTKNKTNHD